MPKGKITWKSGKAMEFECEDLQAFKVSWFGGPGIVPDDVTFEVYEESEDAVEEGEVQEGDLGEHSDGDQIGETEGSGSGDSPVQGGEEQKEKEEMNSTEENSTEENPQ